MLIALMLITLPWFIAIGIAVTIGQTLKLEGITIPAPADAPELLGALSQIAGSVQNLRTARPARRPAAEPQ